MQLEKKTYPFKCAVCCIFIETIVYTDIIISMLKDIMVKVLSDRHDQRNFKP